MNANLPPAKSDRPRDAGAFHIATLSQIPVRLHWTFFILLAYVAWGGLSSGLQMGHASAVNLMWVLALFTCIVLHELGHALIARRYGIRTRDIVLYPIGGIASLETVPLPRQELWIALAGPAVNFLIAFILYISACIKGVPSENLAVIYSSRGLLAYLIWANVLLGIFNLIPAFPMDGGRVLRALLVRRMDDFAATRLAARIGQALAIILGIYSYVSGNFIMLFVALFVYTGAQQEAAAYQTRELITGHKVREAMVREFHTLQADSTLREAAELLLAGNQHDFPVVLGNEIVGMLSRAALMRGLANIGPSGYVTGEMLRNFAQVHPEEPLEGIASVISETGAMLVINEDRLSGESHSLDRLVGIVTQENLYEFLMLSQAQKRNR